jgi:integrase
VKTNPQNTSAAPFISVADALRAVRGATDLTDIECREQCSALNKIVQQDGRPADAIPFTPEVVRVTILRPHATVLGVSAGRKSTIVWHIRQVMHRLGLIDGETIPHAGAWEDLLNRFEEARERATLTALARFCSARQIAPEAVGATTLLALREHLATRTLTANPTKVVGAARGAWNRYGKRIPDWPGQPLPELRPKPPVLPISFDADLDRFAARLRGPSRDNSTFVHPSQRPDGNAELKAAPRRLRESTIALRKSHCRWAATTLVATGFPDEQVTSLDLLVAHAGAILGRLFHDAGDKPSARGMHVAEVLLMIARHYSNRPDEDITWLQQMAQMVKLEYKGITEKNERCVLAALEPSRDEKLLATPGVLMTSAQKRRAADPKDAAGLAWRALLLECLLTIPLRLGDFQQLRLDQHLYRPDPGNGRITAIMIPADETKNDREVRAPVSPPLAAMLATFIRDFRPFIADPVCVYLFPGQGTGNKPLSPQSMRDAVKAVTAQRVGAPLSPHQFRHLAIERFRREFPGEWEMMSQILNHASPQTTRRAYGRNDNRAALARFDDIIAGRRARLRGTSKPKPASQPKPRRGRKGA